MTNLGIIKPVELRNIWKHEANDFTPWLAEDVNLRAPGNAIGIELEFEGKEVSVGPYWADILAKDTGTDDYVVIENQLEKTDHDHLGKCLTYAAVLDAKTIIWIAKSFTDEHFKTLEWLNDHTSDEIAFFGIELRLLQIDDSSPALEFNIVSRPSAIMKQAGNIKHGKEQGTLSSAQESQLKFWTDFRSALLDNGSFRSTHKPRPQYWFDISLGRTNIHLSCTYNTWENKVAIRVYIGNRIADSALSQLEQMRESIESEIGAPLKWNPNPDNRDKVIILEWDKRITDEPSKKEAIQWLATQAHIFHTCFSTRIATMQFD